VLCPVRRPVTPRGCKKPWPIFALSSRDFRHRLRAQFKNFINTNDNKVTTKTKLFVIKFFVLLFILTVSNNFKTSEKPIYYGINTYFYYYWYSALGPVWSETRVQSGDWYGSGTLHSGQVLRGSLPLLSPAFRCSRFDHQVPPRPPRRERSQRQKWELWARMLSHNFAEMTTSTPFRVLLHAANLRHEDRRLYFPSEGRRAEDFFALKNPTASAGFEPANLGTKGQHATPRPPNIYNIYIHLFIYARMGVWVWRTAGTYFHLPII